MRSLSAADFDNSTPILVLRRSPGPFQHCALNVARSAGRLGIPVLAVRDGAQEPSMRSRFVVGTLALSPDAPEADWIETLVAMRPRLGRALLLPIDDSAAVLVGDHQTRLAEHFLLPDAPPGIHRRLASKVQLQRIAGELGIPTPASTVPADRHEMLEQAEQRGYPVVLKRAEPWLASLHPGASSVVIAHDPAQLRAGFDQIQSHPSSPMLLQEYIPGGPNSVWMFNGYFGASGACLSHFTGRKLRQRGPGTAQG